MNFAINTRSLNSSVPLIELQGEVDVYTAPQLKQQMITLLEEGHIEMVVDLTKVEYLDSTALGVLIGGLKRVRERVVETRVLPVLRDHQLPDLADERVELRDRGDRVTHGRAAR